MYYKILEKKSLIDSNNELKRDDIQKNIQNYQSELIDNFLEENDSSVKSIHINQENIKNDIDILYKHSENIKKITKDSIKVYDDFLEYMKEAGDLYNYSSILEKELDNLHEKIIKHYSISK